MSSYDKAYVSDSVLKGEAPASMGGNMSTYQSKMSGGQGYGFSGKDISRGVMEFSSYKSGGAKSRRKRSVSRRQKRSKQSRQRKIVGGAHISGRVLAPLVCFRNDMQVKIAHDYGNGQYLAEFANNIKNTNRTCVVARDDFNEDVVVGNFYKVNKDVMCMAQGDAVEVSSLDDVGTNFLVRNSQTGATTVVGRLDIRFEGETRDAKVEVIAGAPVDNNPNIIYDYDTIPKYGGGAKTKRSKRSGSRSRSRSRSPERIMPVIVPHMATVLNPIPFIDSDRVSFRIMRQLPNGDYLVTKGPHGAGKIRISQIFYPGNNFTNDNGIINIPEKTAFLNDMNNRNKQYTTSAIINRFTMGQNVSIRGFANGSRTSLMVESEDGEIAEVGIDRVAFAGESDAGKYIRIPIRRDVYLRSNEIPILSEQEEEAPMVFLPSQ